MFDSYGTPRSTSSIIADGNEANFEIDNELEVKNSPPLQNAPRKIATKQSKVTRIWHPDELFIGVENKDLDKITSFKSYLVTNSSTAKAARDFVCGKLLISDVTQFGIYAIKDQGQLQESNSINK